MKVVRNLQAEMPTCPPQGPSKWFLWKKSLRATPTKPIILTTKPGFVEADGFVMPNRSYGTAMGALRLGR